MDAGQIEREAAEWLIKVDKDGTLEASRMLAAWLASNPRNRVAFLRMSAGWRRLDALRRLKPSGGRVDSDLLNPRTYSLPLSLPNVGLALQTVVVRGETTTEGSIIQAVSLPWFEIVQRLQEDPNFAYELP